MNRINRRRFVAVSSVAATSAVLVACGNEPADEDELNPTQIPDIAGAPPTLAPITGTPGAASPEGEGGGEETGGGGGEALVITTNDDFSFSPDQPEVYPGQTVTVTNGGFLPHDLVCDDLGIGTAQLQGGDSEDIVIPEDAAVGEAFHFICTVPGHEQSGMVGDFHIVEAGAAAPAEEEGAEEEGASEEEGGAEEGAATGGSGEPLTITTNDDFSFTPDQPEVTPGQTIIVSNEGFLPHDLVSDDLGIGTDQLNNGESQEIVIPEDAAVGETFHFICTVPGHEQSGMVGDFHIVEAGAAAPAEEEGGEEAAPEEETEEATAAATAETSGDEGAATGGSGEALTITAHDDFSFDPDQPEVYPGQTIVVVNEGFLPHDLVSDDLGIGTEQLNGGDSQEIVIPEDAAVGESFHFICSVPGHEQSGMVGDFTIVEAGAAAPAASGEEGGEEEATEEATAETEEATAAATPNPADNTPMDTTVVGTQWEFSPAEFEMAPGGTITFLNNTDMMMGISAEEWNVNPLTPIIRSVGVGNTGSFIVPEDAEVGSTIEFTSNLSEAENQGMVGTITIVEGDGAAGTPAATPEAGGETGGSGDAVVIEGADDFTFSPSEVEVTPGQTVTFTNVGYLQHDLVCDDLGIGTELLDAGDSEDLVIPEDAAAGETYTFICTVPGHEQSGMTGTFTIV